MGQQLRQPMSRTQGLRTTVYDNLRPRDRELVDMLRMVDSVEQSLLGMPEVKIDGYTIPSNRERRSQQILQAIQGVVDGDARAARKLLGVPATTPDALDDVRASLADGSAQVKALKIYEDVMQMAAPLLHATWADAPETVATAPQPALASPEPMQPAESQAQPTVRQNPRLIQKKKYSPYESKLRSDLQDAVDRSLEVQKTLLGDVPVRDMVNSDFLQQAIYALDELDRGSPENAESILPEVRKLALYQERLAPLVKKIVSNAVELGSTAAQTAAYERVRAWRRMGGQGKRLPKWLQETLSK
jgi:hypothetical protein